MTSVPSSGLPRELEVPNYATDTKCGDHWAPPMLQQTPVPSDAHTLDSVPPTQSGIESRLPECQGHSPRPGTWDALPAFMGLLRM